MYSNRERILAGVSLLVAMTSVLITWIVEGEILGMGPRLFLIVSFLPLAAVVFYVARRRGQF